MSNFKSGSGNLDFGGSGGNEETDESDDDRQRAEAEPNRSETSNTDPSPPFETDSPNGKSTDTGDDQRETAKDETEDEASERSAAEDYPYFVRRSKVGDERDTRLEIHVRDEVAEREAAFRNELAEHLGASEVSKTDAREFALLAAYEHPKRVAELMEEEGFGVLD